jgi:steroid delta-isomerase-like uncharacterized protein
MADPSPSTTSRPKSRGKGPTSIARAYFEAINSRDLDTAMALWEPGGLDRLVGIAELSAPHGIREYFGQVFAAFPDFDVQIVTVAAAKEHAAVRWQATGTFSGPGRFEGLSPTGARLEVEGCDMLTIRDGRIHENHAYLNGADLARQLGAMPPAGSHAERVLTGAVNAKTAAQDALKRFRERR